MSKKWFGILLVGILMMTLLAACEKPASTAPAATTTGGEIPFPVQQPTTSLGVLATQTAMAKNPPAATAAGTQPAGTQPPAATKAPAQPQPTTAAGTPAAPQPTAAAPAAPAATATAKPQVVVPTATPGRPATYTIQSGDHLFCIARRYNLNPETLFSLNGLNMNSQLSVGAVIKLPQDGSWPTASGARALKAHPDTYTVQAGDTLNKVACTYGDVDPNAIIAANSLKEPYTLTAGQALNIP